MNDPVWHEHRHIERNASEKTGQNGVQIENYMSTYNDNQAVYIWLRNDQILIIECNTACRQLTKKGENFKHRVSINYT